MIKTANKIFLKLHEYRRIVVLLISLLVSVVGYAQIDVDSRNQEPTRQERYTVREGKKKNKSKRQKSKRTYSNRKQLKRNGDGRTKAPSRFFGGNDIKEKKITLPLIHALEKSTNSNFVGLLVCLNEVEESFVSLNAAK